MFVCKIHLFKKSSQVACFLFVFFHACVRACMFDLYIICIHINNKYITDCSCKMYVVKLYVLFRHLSLDICTSHPSLPFGSRHALANGHGFRVTRAHREQHIGRVHRKATGAGSVRRWADDGWINGWIIGWLVVSTPQKKRKTSQLGWLFPIYGKKNVPNHQPKEYWLMAIDGDWWWISFLTAKSSVIGSCSTSMLVYPRVTMWINDILTCQGLPRLCAAVVCSLFDAAKVWPTTPMFQHAQFSSVFPKCGGTCLCNSSIN